MLCANRIFKYYLKARCQHAACCICHWGWLRLGSLMSTKQAWHRSFILLTHLCCWIQQASNLVWSRLTCTRNQLWVESSGTLGWWFVNVQCSKTSSSDHVYHSLFAGAMFHRKMPICALCSWYVQRCHQVHTFEKHFCDNNAGCPNLASFVVLARLCCLRSRSLAHCSRAPSELARNWFAEIARWFCVMWWLYKSSSVYCWFQDGQAQQDLSSCPLSHALAVLSCRYFSFHLICFKITCSFLNILIEILHGLLYKLQRVLKKYRGNSFAPWSSGIHFIHTLRRDASLAFEPHEIHTYILYTFWYLLQWPGLLQPRHNNQIVLSFLVCCILWTNFRNWKALRVETTFQVFHV